ncbi:replication-associated recombination protein A [bacterium]|nr:replication-associated recombination protein A [bacterium]
MRPSKLEDLVGQEHLTGKGSILNTSIAKGHIPSMILWGPPGVGKTTIANIIAHQLNAPYFQLSAISSGVKEVREVIEQAKDQSGSVLFIDEIHRFNKGQQDALLAAVEKGIITLIGATTENPSFEVNAALLSRMRVLTLNQISPDNLAKILKRALQDNEKGLGKLNIQLTDEALLFLATIANGDARNGLNTLELVANVLEAEEKTEKEINHHAVSKIIEKNTLLYDKGGEEHYNIISALHKSMRGGDANAALYWLGRMLEAGEDPLYVTRRLIRFASEDIGLADPQALVQAVAAHQASHAVGMPECSVNIAQCVAYLANTKKSNALYTAYANVQEDIRHLPNLPVPLHLRNAPTSLMKNMGYGKGYKYTPNFSSQENAAQDYLPKELQKKNYLKGI